MCSGLRRRDITLSTRLASPELLRSSGIRLAAEAHAVGCGY
jgi:hypothetical protein